MSTTTEEEETLQSNYTVSVRLSDLLSSKLLWNEGNGLQTPITFHEAVLKTYTKVVALYFADIVDHIDEEEETNDCIIVLKEAHKQWKDEGFPMKIIYIAVNDEKEEYIQRIGKAHGDWTDWLSLRYDSAIHETLMRRFGIDKTPSLVFVTTDGKVLDGHGLLTISMNDGSDVAEHLMLKCRQKRDKERSKVNPFKCCNSLFGFCFRSKKSKMEHGVEVPQESICGTDEIETFFR